MFCSSEAALTISSDCNMDFLCIAQAPPTGAEREKTTALQTVPHLKPHFSRPGSAYVLQMQPLVGVRETKVCGWAHMCGVNM